MLVYLFLLGLVFGSFYVVVGERRPENKSIIKPGSHCNYCNHKLSWYELIPVLSYIIQGGRCRKCKKLIPPNYPFIELCTGFLFSLAYFLYGISYEFFAMLVIVSLMVIIFVSDFKYKVILDGPLVIGSILILLLKLYYFNFKTVILSLISGLAIFIFMLIIKFVGDKIFKTESLGGGDIKLSTFFGFSLGIRLGLISLILGCFIAFPYAIIQVLTKKEKEIPFGPFLILGMFIVFLLETHILNFIDYII